jgi:hypothetical protein
VHAFLARGVRKISEPQDNPREVVSVELVRPEAVLAMIMAGRMSGSNAVSCFFLAFMKIGRLDFKP